MYKELDKMNVEVESVDELFDAELMEMIKENKKDGV